MFRLVAGPNNKSKRQFFVYFYGKYLEYAWLSTRSLINYSGLSDFIQHAEDAVHQVNVSLRCSLDEFAQLGFDQIRTSRIGQSLSIEGVDEETSSMVTDDSLQDTSWSLVCVGTSRSNWRIAR